MQTSESPGMSRKLDVLTSSPAALEAVSVLSKLILKSFPVACNGIDLGLSEMEELLCAEIFDVHEGERIGRQG